MIENPNVAAALPPRSARASWSDSLTWPLLLAWAVFAALLTWLTLSILGRCQGHFSYPMDDTYIHMAMARSLSQHGVWGLTRYGFSSSSSSPLFTLLLAAVYLVTGPSQIAPFVINVVCGLALLWLCDRIFRRAGLTAIWRAALLLLVVFVMPLAPETLAGMEHVLQTLLAVAFVFAASRRIAEAQPTPAAMRVLCLLGALVVTCRYESLALVAIAAALLWIRRQRIWAMALACVSVLPVAVFGVYSMSRGWFPAPNSIVAKVSRPGKGLWPYPLHWAEQLHDVPSLLLLAIAATVLLAVGYRRRFAAWSVEAISLLLFIAAALAHAQFGRVGWFFRYEAYLIVIGILTCGIAARALLTLAPLRRPAAQVLAGYAVTTVLAAAAFVPRAVGSLWLTPYACCNIYDQQYQVGLFLKRYFAGDTVILSDIGAPAFLSDSPIVDFYGLANMAVTRAKIHHAFDLPFRRRIARDENAKVAAIFPAEFDEVGGLPPEWLPAGSWTIPENQVCWSDTVVFFAVDPAYRERLESDLAAFAHNLPPGVRSRLSP